MRSEGEGIEGIERARWTDRRGRAVVARASPAGQRVLLRGGWDVCYGADDQLKAIAELQAVAFFEPVNAVVDPLLLEYFKTDVSVTLGKKYEYLDSRRFAPLVATAPAEDGGTRRGLNGWSDVDGNGGGAAGGGGGRWPPSTSKKGDVVGVVELSVQRDADVLRRLPVPMQADANGLLGAVTPWATKTAAGGPRSAEGRAGGVRTKARPGRWQGGAPCDEYAYVSCMCVREDWRRRGAADALMAAAEKVTKQWGFDYACLHVFQRNAGAIALYRACGYEIVDDQSSTWDTVIGKQRYLMVKRLR